MYTCVRTPGPRPTWGRAAICLVAALLLSASPVRPQQTSQPPSPDAPVFFYAGGKKYFLKPATRWIAVEGGRGVSMPALERRVKAQVRLDPTRSAVRHDGHGILVLPVPAEESAASSRQRASGRLERLAGVRRSVRVFENGSLPPIVETDEFLIRFRPEVSAAAAAALLSRHGARILRPLPPSSPNGYVARVEDPTRASSIDVANALYGRPGVVFAHPNLIRPRQKRAAPNDPLFSQQWHLNNSGQNGGTPGADIRAAQAWDISRGGAGVVIAVIDDGVDIDHEDLRGKVVAPRDAADGDSDPRPSGDDAHGTAVAGVATAIANNARGVSGVAPLCRLMPIRLLVIAGFTAEQEASAFVWAADHGADVINCSYGAPDDGQAHPLDDTVRDGIDYATDTGRNRLGCVIVFSAGNGYQVGDNADLDGGPSYARVISVAASTNKDLSASYSEEGTSVDLCAPSSGGTLGVATTDITGFPGYSASGYTNGFGGTSSAAPVVSGVAALVLSVNPGLTYVQVREHLQNTADKIDPSGGDYGANGHSVRYGYGRVNALRALQSLPAWTAVDVAVGGDNRARLLWNRGDGAARLWRLSPAGGVENAAVHGPYEPWSARSVAAGNDGRTRLLWAGTFLAAGVWSVAAGGGIENYTDYGSYPGWSVTDLAVGGDGKTRLLWNGDNGAAGWWLLSPGGSLERHAIYGPYAGWRAAAVSAGSGDGKTRLLWNHTDGRGGFWNVSETGGIEASFIYGPYAGWSARDIAVGADGKTRLLWNKSDGTAGLWVVTSTGGIERTVSYGPYAGWTARAIAMAPDGRLHLLWNHADGRAGLWVLSTGLVAQNYYTYTP